MLDTLEKILDIPIEVECHNFCVTFVTYSAQGYTVFKYNSITNPAELNMSIEKYGNASSVFGEHFKGVKSAWIAGPTVIPNP